MTRKIEIKLDEEDPELIELFVKFFNEGRKRNDNEKTSRD